MYDALNANLRHIVEVKDYICGYSESKENGRCYHEQDRVEVGLARGLGCRDADRFEDDILSISWVSTAPQTV